MLTETYNLVNSLSEPVAQRFFGTRNLHVKKTKHSDSITHTHI